jgi:hypothetical protein
MTKKKLVKRPMSFFVNAEPGGNVLGGHPTSAYSLRGARWRPVPGSHPVFRDKFVEGLRQAYRADKLSFYQKLREGTHGGDGGRIRSLAGKETAHPSYHLSAARKPIPARQFAACPESSPDFLPLFPDFPLFSRIEMLISGSEMPCGSRFLGGRASGNSLPTPSLLPISFLLPSSPLVLTNRNAYKVVYDSPKMVASERSEELT